MANLEVNFCGVRIKNPLVAASAEPTLNANNLKNVSIPGRAVLSPKP